MEVQQPFFLGCFSIYVDIEIIVDQELIVITFTFRSRRFIFNMQYFPLIFASSHYRNSKNVTFDIGFRENNSKGKLSVPLK